MIVRCARVATCNNTGVFEFSSALLNRLEFNSILYTFLSPPFRAGFVKLLPCMRPRGAVEETMMLSRLNTSRMQKKKEKIAEDCKRNTKRT